MRSGVGVSGRSLKLTCGLVLGATLGVSLRASPAQAKSGMVCPTADARSALRRQALASQASLEAVKVEYVETDVPQAAQVGVLRLKEELVRAIDAEVVCHGGSDAELERTLATALQANLPRGASTSAEQGGSREDAAAGPYGGGMEIAVTRPRGAPGMLAINVGFAVACGDDHLLLLYARRDDRWERRLRWQSPRYSEVSGAFGGFFLFDVLSGAEQPRVVAVHGTDWCMSRFSSGGIDVLDLQTNGDVPRLVWHTTRALSRGDYAPRLKVAGGEFEVRWNAPAMDVASYERTVVYRYRVQGDGVLRLTPMAVNGRGFVEEWLAAPWSEAETQTAVDRRERLQDFHAEYEQAEKSEDTYVSLAYGPVTACAIPKEFQVEMDTEARGGGEHPEFFRIRETGKGYEMMDVVRTADARCKERDLLPAKRVGRRRL